MSPMHVVLASHQQLPAKGYGGPQRVVVALTRGLAALGHRVTLLALAGSRVPEAKVVEVPARKFDDAAHLAPYVPGDADILHAHVPVKPGPPGSNLPPLLHSIHRNLKPGAPAHVNAVFLSRDHARRHGSEVFIYNGLDPAEYIFRRFPKRAEQFDLFLGNLHSAKGYHWAVEAAKHAGHRLVVAGGWRPSFTGAVKYVGEVDGAKKAALLARARCVWNPAQWDEPFGLVTIEAFLSGTPVLGTRRGALPELITPEVGALCDTMEEMIAAAQTIHTRRPEACRALAERRFTHVVMAEEYVRMYRCLLDTGELPPRLKDQYVVLDVAARLRDYLRIHPVGQVLISPADISWAPDVLVQPDVFVTPIAEARTFDWKQIKTLLLAIEVLSPSTSRYDRFTKRRLYQEYGVPWYWTVDIHGRAGAICTPEAACPATELEQPAWHPMGRTEPRVLPLADILPRV